MPEWDSLKQVNLICAIGEEFGMDFGPELFDELVSFESILRYVTNHAQNNKLEFPGKTISWPNE